MTATVVFFSRVARSREGFARLDLIAHKPGGHDHDQSRHGRRKSRVPNVPDVDVPDKQAATRPAPKRTSSGKISRPRKQPARLTALDIQQAVRSGVADEQKMALGDNGETSLIRTGDGKLLVRKKFAPVRNHTIKDQMDAEDLSLRLGRAVGAPVPNVHIDRDNDTIYMELMAGRISYGTPKERIEKARSSEAGKRLGILDLMIDNNDRHRGNWLIDSNGDPVGIDHSFAFRNERQRENLRYDEEGFVRPVFRSFTEDFSEQWSPYPTTNVWATHLPLAEMRRMRREIELTRPHFEQSGRLDWYQDAIAVFDGLVSQAERAVS